MNSTQESNLNMKHSVISHGNSNAAIVLTVPAFDALFTILKAKVSSIDATAQLEAQVISGIATDKKNLRETLAQQAADIAAVVYSYAVGVNNSELQAIVDFSKTDLLRLRDDQLAPTCKNIHDVADDNLAALATSGITAPMLAAFNTLIDQYTAKVPAPRNARTLKKTYAATLKTLFKESDTLLKKQMDKLAVQFKTANLDFYNTYKNNRITVDPAVSKTQFAGTITNSVTNVDIYNVVITVDGQSYTIKSNLDGSYNLRIPIPGVYTLIFTAPGYQTLQVPNVSITLGQTTTLNVTLTPAP